MTAKTKNDWKEYAMDERRRANAAEGKLIMATAELVATRKASEAVVAAWYSLKSGDYDKDIIETWLLQKMKPAIIALWNVMTPSTTGDYDGISRCGKCKQIHSPTTPCV